MKPFSFKACFNHFDEFEPSEEISSLLDYFLWNFCFWKSRLFLMIWLVIKVSVREKLSRIAFLVLCFCSILSYNFLIWCLIKEYLVLSSSNTWCFYTFLKSLLVLSTKCTLKSQVDCHSYWTIFISHSHPSNGPLTSNPVFSIHLYYLSALADFL